MTLAARSSAVLLMAWLVAAPGCSIPHNGLVAEFDAATDHTVPPDDRPVDERQDEFDVVEGEDTPPPDDRMDVQADMPPPMDVPDVQPPMDAPDVQPPVDVQPDVPIDTGVDVQPDVPVTVPDVVATVAPGGACVAAVSQCTTGYECFAFAGGSFCAACGGYGQRPCAGNVCHDGTAYTSTGPGICIRAMPFSAGSRGHPGGGCTSDRDCGGMQCADIGSGNGLCIECADGAGTACCCSGTTCACGRGSGETCTTGTGGGWTVCH